MNSNNIITKDTPIFCYVQENKQTFSTKLQDNNLAFKIDIHREIKRDSSNNIILQNPAFIFLSFFPFKNSYQAHTTSSQKLQILVEDIARGYIIKDFRIPLVPIQKSEIFQEWIRDSYRFNECFKIVDENNCGISNISYKITTQTGKEYTGITDKDGYTQRIYTKDEEKLTLEILG